MMTRMFCVLGLGVFALLLFAGVATAADEAMIKANLDKLPAADRPIAEAQKFCAIQTGNRLGTMGAPIKVTLEGQPVFLCCGNCKAKALADPKGTLASAEKLKAANAPKKP